MAASPLNLNDIEQRLQAERQAMGATLASLRDEVRRKTDLVRQIRTHPGWATAAAVVAGYGLGRLVRRLF